MMKHILKSAGPGALWTLSAVLLAPSLAHGSALILSDLTLSGAQDTVAWESPLLNSSNASSAPTTGTGTIEALSPGYRASAGFYSWGGDYGAAASTTTSFDTQNVVFQLGMMANPDYTTQEILNYDGTYLSGFSPEGGYSGGPILNYNGGSQGLQATASGVLAGPENVTISGFSGDLSSYAWQWDLSGVTETITSFEITAPIIIHQSTVEARIDSSDSYSMAVPEPSTYAAFAGIAALSLVLFRRKTASN